MEIFQGHTTGETSLCWDVCNSKELHVAGYALQISWERSGQGLFGSVGAWDGGGNGKAGVIGGLNKQAEQMLQ